MHEAVFRALAVLFAVGLAVGTVVGAPPAVLGGLAYLVRVCSAF